MDKHWVFLFILLFINIIWCEEQPLGNYVQTRRNRLRNSRARFPILSSFFGSNDKRTTSIPRIENAVTESSTNSYASGIWNYFRPSYADVGDKNKQNTIMYTTMSYPADLENNNSKIYNSQNYGIYTIKSDNDGSYAKNISSDGYYSEGSVIYTIQNNTGPISDSVIHTTQDKTLMSGENLGNDGTVTYTILNGSGFIGDSSFYATQNKPNTNKQTNFITKFQGGDNKKTHSEGSDSVASVSGENIANGDFVIYTTQNSSGSIGYNPNIPNSNKQITFINKFQSQGGDNTKTHFVGTDSLTSMGGDIFVNDGSVIYTMQNGSGSIGDKQNSQSTNKQTTFTNKFQPQAGSNQKTHSAGSNTLTATGGEISGNDGSVIYTIQNGSGSTGDIPSTNKQTTIRQSNGGDNQKSHSGSNTLTPMGGEVFGNDGSIIYTLLNGSSSIGENQNIASTNKQTTFTSQLQSQEDSNQKTLSAGNDLLTSIIYNDQNTKVILDKLPNIVSDIKNSTLHGNVFLENIKETSGIDSNYLDIQNNKEANCKVMRLFQMPLAVQIIKKLGKYESSNILQEYKDAMVEKEGASEWAAIADNETPLLLPAQLVVRNISMVIRGKNHYCQIVKIESNLNLQGTQNHSMVVDVAYGDSKPIAPSVQPSDQIIIGVNTITSTIATESASTGLEKNQSNNPSIDKSDTTDKMGVSSRPTDGTYYESKIRPSVESIESSTKTQSTLFESHLMTSSKKKGGDSEETNKKESLFISHHDKNSSQDLHISSYLGDKHSHKDKIFYSKKPHTSAQGGIPYYSTHIYHHSHEVDSKPSHSDETIFISKPIKVVDDTEENDSKGMFIKFNEEDDDISSDFEKINKEAKYAVFSFG
ncbi:hypothetical protein FQR65_LT03183 [Abscondita terminalis]|nr:hypothetical protein FQR65_LT03183 [Abscondita terminalis]